MTLYISLTVFPLNLTQVLYRKYLGEVGRGQKYTQLHERK